MRKFVLAPDSFKGTMSSQRVCAVMEKALRRRFGDCEIVTVPVADGGEGTVSCFIDAAGGEIVRTECTGPFFEKMPAFFGLTDGGRVGIIEMAACCGLPLAEGRKDPSRATTYGVGELMLAAAKRGCKSLIIGLGGSCTNDAGAGAAAGAGVRFLKADGTPFVPVGHTLADVAKIDVSGLDESLRDVEITAMCDITNPLYGKNGAAFVFGPQKGADAAMVELLDCGLKHLGGVIEDQLGLEVSSMPGAGAAGGMGAGMAAFFGARTKSGIETLLDAVHFDDLIRDADAIFTGEGRIDSQSVGGKALSGIAAAGRRQGRRVIAVVGGDETDESVYDMGITAVFPTNRTAVDFSVAKEHSEENLERTMDNILRLMETF